MTNEQQQTTPTAQAAHDRLLMAASRASNVWNHYAAIDPYNTHSIHTENPWRNPDQIMMELKSCRNELIDAWKNWSHETQSPDNSPTDAMTPTSSVFLERMTDTFQDTLEQMRVQASSSTSPTGLMDEEQDLPLDVLVDCLQSAMDLFTPQEQAELVAMGQSKKQTFNISENVPITAHRQHQQRMQYLD
jgi:hypothetical protein